jgi:NAD(P)-dependent dehydrogenase (short-subunit alcohol dehydrogenase family)
VDYNIAKAGLNMLTLLLQSLDDSDAGEEESICFWAVNPGYTKTGFNDFAGTKDPLDSAEAFVRLLQADKGVVPAGTFWEFEQGQFRTVPW